MAVEKTDAEIAEERKWRIERQRHRFRVALGVIVLLVLMYFVIAPISAAYGQPLSLPPVELVMIFLAIVSFPAFGVHLGVADVARAIVTRVRIVDPSAQRESGGNTDR